MIYLQIDNIKKQGNCMKKIVLCLFLVMSRMTISTTHILSVFNHYKKTIILRVNGKTGLSIPTDKFTRVGNLSDISTLSIRTTNSPKEHSLNKELANIREQAQKYTTDQFVSLIIPDTSNPFKWAPGTIIWEKAVPARPVTSAPGKPTGPVPLTRIAKTPRDQKIALFTQLITLIKECSQNNCNHNEIIQLLSDGIKIASDYDTRKEMLTFKKTLEQIKAGNAIRPGDFKAHHYAVLVVLEGEKRILTDPRLQGPQ